MRNTHQSSTEVEHRQEARQDVNPARHPSSNSVRTRRTRCAGRSVRPREGRHHQIAILRRPPAGAPAPPPGAPPPPPPPGAPARAPATPDSGRAPNRCATATSVDRPARITGPELLATPRMIESGASVAATTRTDRCDTHQFPWPNLWRRSTTPIAGAGRTGAIAECRGCLPRRPYKPTVTPIEDHRHRPTHRIEF